MPPADWSVRGRWSEAFVTDGPLQAAANTLDKDQRPMRAGSRFEQLLRDGRFAVTCEINPPDSADPLATLDRVRPLIGVIVAVHISDNSLASPHMCGLALAALIEHIGMETILYMTCRDRNRNMLQADVLGAARSASNTCCVSPAITRPSAIIPKTKPVFDLDSVSLINTVRHLRDEGSLLSGRSLDTAPKLMIGGGAEHTAPPLDFRPYRLAKKVAAGVDFAVTQLVYDMDQLEKYMHQVRELGLDRKIHILVSVGALSGPGMARGMNNSSPGVTVPDDIIRRMESAPQGKRRDEGVKICVEQIQQLLEMPGISGVDIMDLDPG